MCVSLLTVKVGSVHSRPQCASVARHTHSPVAVKAKLISSRDNIHNIKFSRGDSLFLSVEMSGLLRELELTYHPTKQTNTIFPILSTSFQPMLLSIFLSPERNS